MQAKGKTILRITGILEILIGIGSLAMIFWILSSNEGTILGIEVAKSALLDLVMIYGRAGIQIIAGIAAIMFAGNARKYKVLYFFGMLMILMEIYPYYHMEYSITNILSSILCTIVPAYYLWGAMKNKQSY